MVVASTAAAELQEEDEEEEDEEVDMEEDCSTKDLVPQKAAALWATVPVAPGFWAVGPSDKVTGRGLATPSRAWGTALPYRWRQQPQLR